MRSELNKGAAMNHLFSSGSKKLQTIVFINTLLLNSISMVYAQSQNINGEKNTRKPVVTEEKLLNKSDATNEVKKKEKKKSKQELMKTENYKGGQPPEGGRVGQGGFVDSD
jgi:hypothetical protein